MLFALPGRWAGLARGQTASRSFGAAIQKTSLGKAPGQTLSEQNEIGKTQIDVIQKITFSLYCILFGIICGVGGPVIHRPTHPSIDGQIGLNEWLLETYLWAIIAIGAFVVASRLVRAATESAIALALLEAPASTVSTSAAALPVRPSLVRVTVFVCAFALLLGALAYYATVMPAGRFRTVAISTQIIPERQILPETLIDRYVGITVRRLSRTVAQDVASSRRELAEIQFDISCPPNRMILLPIRSIRREPGEEECAPQIKLNPATDQPRAPTTIVRLERDSISFAPGALNINDTALSGRLTLNAAIEPNIVVRPTILLVPTTGTISQGSTSQDPSSTGTYRAITLPQVRNFYLGSIFFYRDCPNANGRCAGGVPNSTSAQDPDSLDLRDRGGMSSDIDAISALVRALLAATDTPKIVLVGHADPVGAIGRNRELSRRRTQVVFERLTNSLRQQAVGGVNALSVVEAWMQSSFCVFRGEASPWIPLARTTSQNGTADALTEIDQNSTTIDPNGDQPLNRRVDLFALSGDIDHRLRCTAALTQQLR